MTTALRNKITPTWDDGSGLARAQIPSRRNATLSGPVAVIVALLLAACSGGDGEAEGTTTSAETGTSGTSEVTMQDISFQPGEITVEVGTEVTWTNADGVTHTTTSEDAAWDSGDLSSGSAFSHTFDDPGTYTYICEIHPSMQGTVTVEG